jgi:hypothetical protein
MNAFVNSEISCRLPPLALADKVLMVLAYLGSATATVTALVLLYRSFF